MMLKITDPVKRDLIVKEYLEITKKIATETQEATEGTSATSRRKRAARFALLLTFKIVLKTAVKIVLKTAIKIVLKIIVRN